MATMSGSAACSTAIVGTDGSDFTHRQKIASHYKTSAVNKSRLRTCIFFHYLIFLLMLAKLSEDILDRFDIFILELEELYIPKPLIWEWLWVAGLLFTFVGLNAAKKNNLNGMIAYTVGTFSLNMCSVIGAGIYYFNDMYQYAETRDTTGLETWQGYPLAVLWYAFLTAAFQVHLFSLFFAVKLILAWRKRRAKKTQ